VDFVKNNLLLIAIAFASGAMLMWPLFRRGTGGPWVTTLEATQLMNRSDALVIDVREPAEYAQGHIIGAKSVPLGELERRAPDLSKNKAKPLIVHCERGNRAGAALQVLRRHGYGTVYNLTGGYAAWQAAGLPTAK
jgi:rhodanese-related sulfurtransferase